MYCKQSYRVMAQDLLGIKALEIQLASGEVIIPDLPMIRMSAVFALLQFNRNKYIFPETNFTTLLYQVFTADILGADKFMGFVGEKLCLPSVRFDLSNNNEMIWKVLRDRYRLARKVILSFPSSEICYGCKKAVKESEIRKTTPCCYREFHECCLEARTLCPYCCEPWLALRCVVCKKSCTLTGKPLYESFSGQLQMACCSAEVHSACLQKMNERCLECQTELKNGIPVPVASANDFCKRRWCLRQVQLRRKQLAADN